MSAKDTVAILAAAAVLAALINGTKPTSAAKAASPLGNASGTLPGLAPVTTGPDKRAARALIKDLRVATRGSSAGYRRARYGGNWADSATGVPYARNGCRTRDDLLARDGHNIRYRKGSTCEVIAMDLHDPYTGQIIDWHKRDAGEIQVDHVVPLAYGWRMGARHWTMTKRLDFANDPLNLLPVLGRANEQKDAAGPSGWLPPHRRIRCAYVTRFAQVATKYGLPVTRADRKAMLTQCR